MAYGESSSQNDDEEMAGIAAVLLRQRNARGYGTFADFIKKERSFSFVVADGNKRYTRLMNATEKQIQADEGMTMALIAAQHVLGGGFDESGGAFFWDGADIKTNYKKHFKVKQGIRFSDPTHNIYDIKESTAVVIKYKILIKRDPATGQKRKEKEEVARYDHVYVSTAAAGGTIFWKFNPQYLAITGCKEYK